MSSWPSIPSSTIWSAILVHSQTASGINYESFAISSVVQCFNFFSQSELSLEIGQKLFVNVSSKLGAIFCRYQATINDLLCVCIEALIFGLKWLIFRIQGKNRRKGFNASSGGLQWWLSDFGDSSGLFSILTRETTILGPSNISCANIILQ